MIFVTVGTQFGFDRLIKALDQAKEDGLLEEEFFAQIGPGQYKPKNFEYVEMLEKSRFEEQIAQSQGIVSHAGVGSIILALEHEKPMLVLPRLPQHKELVNDHQLATAQEFERLGHVIAAYSADEIPEKIKLLKTFTPKPRKPDKNELVKQITSYLDNLQTSIAK